MAKTDQKRRRTFLRMVRLRELATFETARQSADLVAAQTRLHSLATRSAAVISYQSARRLTASAAELRHEFGFTQSLQDLRSTSSAQAQEMEPQIDATTQTYGTNKHREELLKSHVKSMTRRAELRANHKRSLEQGEVARKLNCFSTDGGHPAENGD